MQAKLSKQQYALTKLTAAMWGMSLIHIKELYMKVIRNMIAYRASAWHIPIKGGQPKELAKALFII